MDFTTNRCYGCQASIQEAAGVFYCDTCISKQAADFQAEQKAFESFHRFADAVVCHRHTSTEEA